MIRGFAASAAIAALALATVADLALAKPKGKAQGKAYGHQKQVTPAAPVAPVRRQQATAKAPKPVTRKRSPKPHRSAPAPAPTTVRTNLRTTTVVDVCKADPGSCQERGGGNSGDIDPYRGPDAPGNSPGRGNDCDEGGGNNRGTYPRRENTKNGDSDVDNDNGGGNNRCGAAAGTGPGKPGKPGNGRKPATKDQIVVLGAIRGDRVAALEAIEERYARELQKRGDGPDNGGVLGVQAQFLPVDTPLPATGEALLALFLTGGLLALLGFGLRRRVGSLT